MASKIRVHGLQLPPPTAMLMDELARTAYTKVGEQMERDHGQGARMVPWPRASEQRRDDWRDVVMAVYGAICVAAGASLHQIPEEPEEPDDE